VGVTEPARTRKDLLFNKSKGVKSIDQPVNDIIYFIFYFIGTHVMARPQRIIYSDAWYHVMNRGAGRHKIYTDRVDREIFLQTLGEACHQFKIEIHAYCLMENHYHLLIKTPQANLSRAMRHINGVYTQRYNRLKKIDGPLFRGRYKAILVDADAYLLHLSKYIHLNPISARMVDNLEQYEWSSYPAYIDNVKSPIWLVREDIYGQFTANEQKAEHYKCFMANEDLNKKLIKFYSQQSGSPVLGDDEFVNSLALLKPSRETPRHSQVYGRPSISAVISEVAMVFGQDFGTLITVKKGRVKSNIPRKMAMYIARKYGDYRFQELAEAFGLKHYGGASYAVYAFTQELQKDPELEIMVNRVIGKLGIAIKD
jgi:putative transposase